MRRPLVRWRAAGFAGVALSIFACGTIADPFGGAMIGLGAAPARADEVSDQQQRIEDDLAEIERLERRASELNEQYLAYIHEQTVLTEEIAAGEQHIAVRQAELDALQTQLAAVAVQQFTGGSGALSLFGNTSSATENLQRDQLVRTAVNAGAATTDDYEGLLGELSAEQDDLEAKRARVVELAEQAAATLVATEQAGRDYEERLARDQERLGDLLIEAQERQQAEAEAEYAAEVAAAQAARDEAAEEQARADGQEQAQEQAQTAVTSASTSASVTTTEPQSGSAAPPAADVTTPAPPSTTDPPSTTGDDGASTDDDGAREADPDFGAAETAPPATDPPVITVAASSSATGSGDDEPEQAPDDEPANIAPPPVSSRADAAVAAARSQLGVPYRFASSSPGVAFDCSGLTAYAWKQAGVSLPHQSAMQFASTPHVAITDIEPGDLLFYYSPISHVSIYLGNGQQIHAPAPGKFVEIVPVNWGKLVGASRPG